MALSILRKRTDSGYYKTALQFRDDYRLMFNNARKYNQEGSWVYYVDAEEMKKSVQIFPVHLQLLLLAPMHRL